jgi:type I restriction enzyme S subunit
MENKLPKNWVETDLEHLFNLVYGKGLSVSELLDEGFDVYGANGIIGKYDKFTYEKSKIVISCRGAASGVIHKTNPKSFITSNSIVLDEISDTLLNLDFVKYAMTIADKSDVITGTAQPQITIQLLKYLSFPLPPLAEQNRIVAKLDALFVQLETIKASMAKVPLLLKDFRQQVLTQAVTGKLTEEWRKGKELEEWDETILIDVIIEKPRNGFSPKAVDFETPVKSLTLSATTSGRFNPLHVKYLDIEIPSKESHLWLKNGDILIQRSNSLEYVGTAAIFDGSDYDFIYPDIMMKIRANNKILNEYLFYSLSSIIVKNYYKDNASGTAGNMPKINQEIVSKTPINLPPILEQQEIVYRVESLFAKADAIEQQYETLKAKIDSLPQAILHKAFKGELTEQLDTDGDARGLLREIEMLKQVHQDKSKKGKSKTNTSVTQKV